MTDHNNSEFDNDMEHAHRDMTNDRLIHFDYRFRYRKTQIPRDFDVW